MLSGTEQQLFDFAHVNFILNVPQRRWLKCGEVSSLNDIFFGGKFTSAFDSHFYFSSCVFFRFFPFRSFFRCFVRIKKPRTREVNIFCPRLKLSCLALAYCIQVFSTKFLGGMGVSECHEFSHAIWFYCLLALWCGNRHIFWRWSSGIGLCVMEQLGLGTMSLGIIGIK